MTGGIRSIVEDITGSLPEVDLERVMKTEDVMHLVDPAPAVRLMMIGKILCPVLEG